MGEQASGGGRSRYVRVSLVQEIPAALNALALRRGRPVLVLVGGAEGMDDDHLETVGRVLRDAVLPLLDQRGAVVVDGGTDSGVMRVIGRAWVAQGGGFPLVGVAAEGTVVVPGGGPAAQDAAELEPNHTHVVLVPGTRWGDESPWLAVVAGAIAQGRPSVTVVVNGGEITYADVSGSLARGRPVVVLAGTGRTADAIAAARAGRTADHRAAAIAASDLTLVVPVEDAGGIRDAIDAALT